jgi:putative colanic acid biosynthesis glycosyltransferase WcaI
MRILLLNQAFYPDEVATSQYASDLAAALAAAGHDVTVLCSIRGYDNPTRRFFKREVWNAVNIVRVEGTSFGKTAKWRRAVDFASFLVACGCRLPRLGRFDVIIALTSPPLISALGAIWKGLLGGRLVSWIMDLNPDEAIAAGWLDPSSKAAILLRTIQTFSLRHSDTVVVLDTFMRTRLIHNGTPADKIAVLPLWSQDDSVYFDARGREQFRLLHGWEHKFVVMYSGNHSPCHPLDTLIEAAHRLRYREDIVFAFIGGGIEHRKIQARAAEEEWGNIVCLPYQPRGDLAASLSAGDLQAVVMGNAFVGIVSPSKIYNILAVGAPALYIGPAQSHVTELFGTKDRVHRLYSAEHSDVDTVVQQILSAQERGFFPPTANCKSPVGKDSLLPRMMAIVTGEELQATAIDKHIDLAGRSSGTEVS